MATNFATTAYYVCDSCLTELSGYSKRELLAEGWEWHDAGKGRWFVMCNTCLAEYTRRRALKAA